MQSTVPMPPSALLIYCRAGFEAECAQEISALATDAGVGGYAKARTNDGFAEFHFTQSSDASAIAKLCDWRTMIFARQCLPVFAQLSALPRTDRVAPIVLALNERGEHFNDAWVEAPDNDEGKALAPFCKSFGSALIAGLKRAHLLDRAAPRRLHAFFPQSDNVYLASADPATSSPWPQGIARLKFPREAPSRSTLKLDEALLTLLDEGERERWLKPGMSAVDLGAAPGGWTWQLVRRSMHVLAVDNGPMDARLMESGLLTHLREDGFRYRPRKPVDWMVCDMVEQPRRIAELMAQWLSEGTCRRTIFNLKLPMKKRYLETQACLQLVAESLERAGHAADIRAKQLYHDREEITVFAQRV